MDAKSRNYEDLVELTRRQARQDEGLTALVQNFHAIGGVLAYVALRADGEAASPARHRAAA